MAFQVNYSFLHNNRIENQAEEYRVYRQELVNGVGGDFILINTIDAIEVGDAVEITGVDFVDGCNQVSYNYKVSAFNSRGEVECINPSVSGINFPCPTQSNTPTQSVTETPPVTSTPQATPSVTATPQSTPSATSTPQSTPSATSTPEATPSATKTLPTTPSATKTLPATPSPTNTKDFQPIVTQSSTPTFSVTQTNSATLTPTATPTITPTETLPAFLTECFGNEEVNIDISVQNNNYLFSQLGKTDEERACLAFERGVSYTLNIDASTPMSHPFWIKTTNTAGNQDAFNDGVTNNGTDQGAILFDVPCDAPSTLFYQCAVHSNMSGIINIFGQCEPAQATPTATITNTNSQTVTPTSSQTVTPTATITKDFQKPTSTPTSSLTVSSTNTPTNSITPSTTTTQTNTPSSL